MPLPIAERLLLTVRAAAQLTSTSETTIRRLIRDGVLDTRAPSGRRQLVTRQSIDAWLSRQTYQSYQSHQSVEEFLKRERAALAQLEG